MSDTQTQVDTNYDLKQGESIPDYNARISAYNASKSSSTIAPDVAGNASKMTALGVPQTFDASAMSKQFSGAATSQFPPAPPAPTQGQSDNTGVPNPMATMADITNQTPAEATNKSILDKIVTYYANKKGQTELTNEAEDKAGVPALTNTLNDLNTQLEGLNNQSLDLQNKASAGGEIQNKEQQDVKGRGVTTGGLAPITAGDLRKNQIQQSALASRSLTLKSVIYGAQGKLSLAKDAADKAATAQYEDELNQLDYLNAQIAANKPQMDREEKAQADLIQSQVDQRKQQISDSKENKKSILGMVSDVLKNHPDDPVAHDAAMKALEIANSDNPDYSAALQLVGQYQGSPTSSDTFGSPTASDRSAVFTLLGQHPDVSVDQDKLKSDPQYFYWVKAKLENL